MSNGVLLIEKLTLKKARQLAGYTLREVAEITGLSLTMVHLYEKGEHSPTIQTALKLAELYGVTVYDIDFSEKE